MRNLLMICLAGLILSSIVSCKKDPPIIDEGIQKINFNNPEVGQISKYLLLSGENIKHTANTRYEYIQDTMVAEIVEQEGDKYLIKEYLTLGSASLNGENHVSFPDSTIYYFLVKNPDMIRIENTDRRLVSRIFFLRSAQTEGLETEEFHDLKIEMPSWKPSIPFTTNYINAYLEAFELFGESYEHLNVTIENRPMQNRSSGYTHVYSMKTGLVRSSTYSSLTSQGFGWDLIP